GGNGGNVDRSAERRHATPPRPFVIRVGIVGSAPLEVSDTSALSRFEKLRLGSGSSVVNTIVPRHTVFGAHPGEPPLLRVPSRHHGRTESSSKPLVFLCPGFVNDGEIECRTVAGRLAGCGDADDRAGRFPDGALKTGLPPLQELLAQHGAL